MSLAQWTPTTQLDRATTRLAHPPGKAVVIEAVPTTCYYWCCHYIVADGAHKLQPGKGATPPPVVSTRCRSRRQWRGDAQWRQGPRRGRDFDSRASGQASIERPASSTNTSSHWRVQQRHIAPPCSSRPDPSQPANPCIDKHRETWRAALTVVRRQPSPSAECGPHILRCVRSHHRHPLRARIPRRSIKLPTSTSGDDRLQRARARAAASRCHCASWSDLHALQRPHAGGDSDRLGWIY